MKTNELLTTYFNTQNIQINMQEFAIDMLLTALLSYILSVIYAYFGKSLSNRKSFASNFVLLSLTTMLIISIVKSSLALSLGLVGALSIVRFRAAIKEPEELTFLFMAISIGLGFGAEQRYITIFAFFIISLILITKGLIKNKTQIKSNLFINIKSINKLDPDQVMSTINKFAKNASFNRLSEGETSEYLFKAQFINTTELSNFKKEINNKYDKIELTLFEEKDIFN